MQTNGSTLNGKAIGGERKRGGPKTAAGKARSRQNGVRHGGRTVLPIVAALGERAEDFEALREALVAELAPGDGSPLVTLLVERAARLWWRLHRVERAEAIALGEYADAADRDALAAVNEAMRKPSRDPLVEFEQGRQQDRMAPLAPVRLAEELTDLREAVAEFEREAAEYARLRDLPADAPIADTAADAAMEYIDIVASPGNDTTEPRAPKGGWTRRALAKQLASWAGPPPADCGAQPDWLAYLAEHSRRAAVGEEHKRDLVAKLAVHKRQGRLLLDERRAERIGREERRVARELERTLEQIRTWRDGA